jgi:hypothetical protein
VLTGRFGTHTSVAPRWRRITTCSRARRRFGDLPGDVVEQRSEDLHLPAPRPRNSALTSLFASGVGIPAMPPLEDALPDLLARYPDLE